VQLPTAEIDEMRKRRGCLKDLGVKSARLWMPGISEVKLPRVWLTST
jgi:hypothetical protein